MTGILPQLSDALADTVTKAALGVVRVSARRRLPASGIAWAADGLIVTAHHVVEQDTGITVAIDGGEAVPASLVGRDPRTDLAVLRTENGQLSAAPVAQSDGLRVGHLVLALARPMDAVNATLGIVASLGRGRQAAAGGNLDSYVQTDVAMLPGFSGGPLVNSEGEVLGLNTSALARGVSLTIPASTIGGIVDTLVEHGRVRRGYLGMGAQTVRLPEGLAGELDQASGLLLASVEPGAPADKAGLLQGDILLALDGQQLRRMQDLLDALGGDRVGKTVSVQIVRAGQTEERPVVVGERE